MIKTGILLVSFLLFELNFSFASKADTAKQVSNHLFSLNTGYSNQMNRDQAISPFIYTGATVPVEFLYKYQKNRNLQSFVFQFSRLDLESGIDQYPSAGVVHTSFSTIIDLRYSYLKRLIPISHLKHVIYIGGEINSYLNTRDHNFTSVNNYIMADCFNSLSISTAWCSQISHNNQIHLNVSVPVVSYVLLRQTYNAYVGEKIEAIDLAKNVLPQLFKNGDIVSITKFFDIRADFTWVKYFGNRFGISLKYCFHYYKFTQYDDLFYSRNLNNQVLTGIFYRVNPG